MELYLASDERKEDLVFSPQDFIKLVPWLISEKRKAKCILWVDAGLWTYALDWFDHWIKSATKFLNGLGKSRLD